MIINGEYVKGTIEFDRSFKDLSGANARSHQEYRTNVTYGGKRYRKRSRSYEECVKFLQALKREHLAEYLLTCDWCGSKYEINGHNNNSRFCCKACSTAYWKQKRAVSPGVHFIDEHGAPIAPPKRKYKGG